MNELSNALNSSLTAETQNNRFYRTVWRWHFWAGLFVIPFMLVLATTGIIYLFKPQLDSLMYPHQMFVQPAAVMLPYTAQLSAAQKAHPNAKISKFTPNSAPNRSAEVTFTTPDDRNLTVFVNPYTGEVLGQKDEDNNFQSIVRKIHGELMLGKLGDYLVEMASCWGLVLLITGLYLWIPRHKFTIWGTLIPRWSSKNPRIFWRDLHAVPGFYGLLLIAFLILTGLPWSGFWGDTFARVWNQFPAQMSAEVPKSTVLTGSLNKHTEHTVPWAVEKLPMPQSVSTKQNHTGHKDSTSTNYQNVNSLGMPVNFNSIVALAILKGAPAGFSVSFPQGETGVYTISSFPDNPTQETTLHIDQYTGKVLAEVRWKDYGLVPKAVEMGIAIHQGKLFGLANQLLMLFACLVVIVLCISGVVMWWLRRPKEAGLIGAPALPPYVQQWKVPVGIIAILGIAFPLVGLSLITVLLLDYFVLSRIPVLKRIFS